MLPFQPHTMSEHRLRFVQAIQRVWIVSEILKGGLRPGQNLENVFDWPDGLRLIISKDELSPASGEAVVHVSASCFVGTELRRQVEEERLSWQNWLDLAVQRFSEISEGMALEFIGFTGGGIPPWHSSRTFPIQSLS